MDFYDKANKIPGSKWDRDGRYMTVPAEQYEQVLDFAEVHGFGVSDAARKLAEDADKIRYAAMVATPAPAKPSEKADPMSIPEDGFVIDDSLRDKN